MASISVVVSNCGGANQITITQPITVGTGTGVNDTFAGYKNQTISGNVATNDTGCSVGTTTYVKVTDPLSGTVTAFNNTTGAFTYSPNTNFAGTDSFTYRIHCNGVPQTASITVTLTVIGATAVNGTVALNANTPTSFNLSTDDIACNGGATTTYVINTNVSNGSISNFSTATGIGTYTPTTGFTGSDSLTYNILCNGVVVSTASMTFNISCVGVTTAQINGNLNPVSGSTEIYTATNQDGTPVFTYVWTVVDGIILSGQGTSSITVLWN